MTRVVLDQLTKRYDDAKLPAVDHVSLRIDPGEMIALLGPSGCGKTTILKMIAGLLQPTSGDIRFDEESVLAVPAEKRNAVMVFQDHILFPYMNIEQNVGFGLKMRGLDKHAIEERVAEMLELVELPGMSQRTPSQLSGGQQQRVALARALITEPRLLLLDEPLGSLDASLRDDMRELILSIQRRFEITTVVVTHDQVEAVLLADRIALIFEGILQRYAPPSDYFHRPTSERAARFFGGLNFIPAKRIGDLVETPIGDFLLDPGESAPMPEAPTKLTIRPEHIQLGVTRKPNTVPGRLRSCIFMGTHTRCRIVIGDYEIEALKGTDSSVELCEGKDISVHFPPNYIWLFADGSASHD